MAAEVRGQAVEHGVDLGLVAEVGRAAPEASQPGCALPVVREESMHIGGPHPPVARYRAVLLAVVEAQHRTHAVGTGRLADMHLVTVEGHVVADVWPDTARSSLVPVSTVSTSRRPRPSQAPGGPSMPSGSAMRRPSI